MHTKAKTVWKKFSESLKKNAMSLNHMLVKKTVTFGQFR